MVSGGTLLTAMPVMQGALYLIKDVERLGHPQELPDAVMCSCRQSAEKQICSGPSDSVLFILLLTHTNLYRSCFPLIC